MFKNAFQNGLLTVFYSCGSNPLALWDMEVKNGHIKRVTDPEVSSIVLEIISSNVTTTYISCPRSDQPLLGISLPFLVMIVKNMKKYFSFEITVLDETNMRRRFRISNYQTTTNIKPFCTTMPIGLSSGWNQIQFNLADFTKRAYGTGYLETQKIQVNANTRLRRIYFCDRLYSEEELPQDYKLYLPLEKKSKRPTPLKRASKAVEPRKSGPAPTIEHKHSLIPVENKENEKKSGTDNQKDEKIQELEDYGIQTGIKEKTQEDDKRDNAKDIEGDETITAEELDGVDTGAIASSEEPLAADGEAQAKIDTQSKENLSAESSLVRSPSRKASSELHGQEQ